MNKKALILSGSPRKGGNSDLLCDVFLKGAEEAGHKVEKIFLRDKKISYCTGCGLCVSNAHTGCSQNDDMTEILDKMLEADTIIMATPVYFYTMDAQMKTLIDRCCAKYTKITNKEFYFIAAAADGDKSSLEATFDGFKAFLSCLTGAKEKGRIYAAGVWAAGEVENTELIKEAYEMGKSI